MISTVLALALAVSLVANGAMLATVAFVVVLLVVGGREEEAPRERPKPRAPVRSWPPVGEA